MNNKISFTAYYVHTISVFLNIRKNIIFIHILVGACNVKGKKKSPDKDLV